MEEDIELRTEVGQALFDLGEHQLYATSAEGFNSLFGFEGDRIRLTGRSRIGTHLGSNIGDVLATVAVFRRFLTHCTGIEGTREAINLRTVIVEVVLAGYLCTRCNHQTSKRVTNSRPASTAKVNRAGRVCGHVFEVHVLASKLVSGAIGIASFDDRSSKFTSRCGTEPNVDKARSCDLGLVDSLN